MARIEHVGFHPREIAHPRQHFGQVEVDVVPAPDHEGRRLPALQVVGDRVEARGMVGLVRDQGPLRLHVARQVHHAPVLFPSVRAGIRCATSGGTPAMYVSRVPSSVRCAVTAAVFCAFGWDQYSS